MSTYHFAHDNDWNDHHDRDDVDDSDDSIVDDLPDLSAIFAPRPLMATSADSGSLLPLRRSPRKKTAVQSEVQVAEAVATTVVREDRTAKSPCKRQNATLRRAKGQGPVKASAARGVPDGDERQHGRGLEATSPRKQRGSATQAKRAIPSQSITDKVPVLRRNTHSEDINLTVSSGNRQSPLAATRGQRKPWLLPDHGDDLQLQSQLRLHPRSSAPIVKNEAVMASSSNADENERPAAMKKAVGNTRVLGNSERSVMSLMTETGRRSEGTGSGSAARQQSPQKEQQRQQQQQQKRTAKGFTSASRFILNEARCNDDLEDSTGEDDDEDEDTDLSGFIVDDDAELSYHDWSASGSGSGSESGPGSENDDRPSQMSAFKKPRRRLVRGSPTRRRLSFVVDNDSVSIKEEEERQVSSDKDDKDEEAEQQGGRYADLLTNAFTNLGLLDRKGEAEVEAEVEAEASIVETVNESIEVIDLTSSPNLSPKVPPPARSQPISNVPLLNAASTIKPPVDLFSLSDDFDRALKLAPPTEAPSLRIPSKPHTSPDDGEEMDNEHATTHNDSGRDVGKGERDRFRTPPATPPRSPSKLKSPSKLLSPSKRQTIPKSPHRQSTDAFWDHNVINEWNDEYSPKKAPARSPKKSALARFQIWSDSEDEGGAVHDRDEDDEEEDQEKEIFNDSTDSLPSPCSSPRKSGRSGSSRSPTKSPVKNEEKRRLLEQKKAKIAEKKAFDSRKDELAQSLLHELDTHVANSQLSTLAASTGGVKIIWSRTLRSTAGRANWKRTVTRASSPVKSSIGAATAGIHHRTLVQTQAPVSTVQHFASIELADKIIDREDRLVNTLAHEFCHLANFMVSGVRDNPHGASFKAWAAKVTAHLRRNTLNPAWRSVEVTTKHSYVIDHKYLWVCVGREASHDVREFLNMGNNARGDDADADDGCGAEYGRHSKSIDTAKQRCGRCKGMLIQVRPKPRSGGMSPKKRDLSRRAMKRSGSEESTESSNVSVGSQSSLGDMVETIELSD